MTRQRPSTAGPSDWAPAGILARRRRWRPPTPLAPASRTPTLTVQVTLRLSGLDVVRVLAACATAGYQVRVGDELARRDTLQLLRTVVAGHGHRAGTGWDTNLTHDQTGAVVRWAADQTRRLWPHLSTPALSQHVTGFAPPLVNLDLDPDGHP